MNDSLLVDHAPLTLSAATSFLALLFAVLYLLADPLRSTVHRLRVNWFYNVRHVSKHRSGGGGQRAVAGTARGLPVVGEVLHCDFRSPEGSLPPSPPNSLRVVSWNIEMGYQCSRIIAELVELDADVLLLQEVDIFEDNTTHKNMFVEIGRGLGMAGVYCGHFRYRKGIWGNAVFSKYPIFPDSAHFIPLKHLEGYDRSALAVRVALPLFGPTVVCSVHLEVCCGISHRVQHFEHLATKLGQAMNLSPWSPLILGGDFNTMGDSLIRFSPFHCCDSLRWRTIGKKEAEWWVDHVFSRTVGRLPLLFDPFDKVNDWTLEYTFPGLGLLRGRAKLDWLLFNRAVMTSQTCAVGKGDQSDHKWLLVAVSAVEKD